MNVAKCGDRAGLGDRVRVHDQHGVAAGARDAEVDVGRKPERAVVLDRPAPVRRRAGHVRDHEQLVDLRLERRERLGELGRVPVRDDDRGHLHASTFR